MLLLQNLSRYTRNLFAVMTLGSVLLLQGCSGGSDDPAPTYGIGGSVSGLTGTVVLQNNGGSDLTITANGDFTFGTSFANGTSYAVTVLTNPSGQGCTVSNGSGSVNGATVSNISVSCENNANPTGYYKQGTLTNSSGVVIDSAFQAIVHDGRLMMISNTNGLLFDGDMTIAAKDFTTTAIVYIDGIKNVSTVTITGYINAGTEITGDISDGRSFTLTYAPSNNTETSDLADIQKYPLAHGLQKLVEATI